MSLTSIRQGIVAALNLIPDLTVYDHVPEAINEFPAASIRVAAASYADRTFTFQVRLVVSGWSSGEAEKSLHPFLEAQGDRSVKAALDAQPGCVTVGAGETRRRNFNGASLLSVELTVVATDA